MFRRTSPQTSLLESRFLVPPEKRARLERSWAEAFRVHVLPLIDEEPFRECFCEDNGRPNKSIKQLVGLHILKEADDLTDEQVLEQFEFNLQWHHALGVVSTDASICQKTLHNFRVRLLKNERARAVFDQVTTAIAQADGLSVARQRLDSTHIISNIAVLTRLGLFVETLANFLRELKSAQPEKLSAVKAEYRKRYLEREGYFADVKRELARRRLPVVATDLHRLLTKFRDDSAVTALPSYQLMQRLFDEQCVLVPAEPDALHEPADEDSPSEPPEPTERVVIREPKEISSQSMQSPYDPDATYGHKGKGYEAQIAETCVEGNPYQVITDVDVNGAHVSDQHAVVPAVERLAEKGMRPDELTADTGFGSGENIVACAQRDVDLQAPVQDPHRTPAADRWAAPVEGNDAQPTVVGVEDVAPKVAPENGAEEGEKFGLERFDFSSDFESIVNCPAGHEPTRQWGTHGGARVAAEFDPATCASCPFAAACPTKARRTGGPRQLGWRPAEAATTKRQIEQQTPEFKERYKIRSGIESTNSVLKGVMGAGELRVRGQPRVTLAICLKALALNVSRCLAYHLKSFQVVSAELCPG
jgi:hypothetical protein